MSFQPSLLTLPAVARHEGPPSSFLKRVMRQAFMAARGSRKDFRMYAAYFLKWIADTRNLKAAWNHLSTQGGPASGPNGWTYTDYTNTRIREILRELSESILNGTYEPEPPRPIEIDKSDGGIRILQLSNLRDRVTYRAVYQILDLFLDPGFSVISYCRRRRGRFDALATVEAMVEETGRLIWIVDDVKNAFPSVPLKRMNDLVRKKLQVDDIVDLVATILGTGTKGLQQGSSLSPLLLNLYLDRYLDKPWERRFPSMPLYRYIDDILGLASSLDDARSHYSELSQLLDSAGMPLKGNQDDSIHDLSQGAGIPWLGFDVSYSNGGMVVRLPLEGEKIPWLDGLRESFDRAHFETDPPIRALQIIDGFVDQAGASFRHTDHREAYERIVTIAHKFAFEELPDFGLFEKRWAKAFESFQGIRNRVRRERKRRSNRT